MVYTLGEKWGKMCHNCCKRTFRVRKKGTDESDRQYFGRNFDKFRQLFIIFGMNHPDNPCD